MDEADLANRLAEADRQALIDCAVERGHRQRAAPRHGQDGQRICISCEQPISTRRLAAVPHAVACTECEAEAEKAARHYRKGNPWAV